MSESPVHKERVQALVEWMKSQGVNVTHAAGATALPDPGAMGRHEPDALGVKEGVTWIGEAKVGTDLTEQTSQEQFADFSRHHMTESGAPCPFILCVPKGYVGQAQAAVVQAGGNASNLNVVA